MTLCVEFHCHTLYSKDSLTKPGDLVKAARRKGLERVVVTDHNAIEGARLAQKIDPELVIVGEEVLTTQGELLAAFVTELVPPNLPPLEALRRLRDQGAFISVSHPFDAHRGWKLADLLEILPLVDALETFNSRCMDAAYNHRAQEFARAHRIAETVGSDAHTAWELGRATLTVEKFGGSEELRQVIRQGTAKVKLSSPLIHLTSRYAVLVKQMRGTSGQRQD